MYRLELAQRSRDGGVQLVVRVLQAVDAGDARAERGKRGRLLVEAVGVADGVVQDAVGP